MATTASTRLPLWGTVILAVAAMLGMAAAAYGQDFSADLAKTFRFPSPYSSAFPSQLNHDHGYGPPARWQQDDITGFGSGQWP